VILVEKPPNIIPLAACPATRVKVVGWSGYKLRVRSYDLLNGEQLMDWSVDITSDVYTDLVAWATRTYRSTILAVLEVVDTQGNIQVRWAQPFIHVPDAITLELPDVSSVVYVSKVGGVSKYVERTRVAYLDPMLFVIIRRPGYLCIYDGANKVIEVSGESAFITLTFKVPYDITRAFGNYVDSDEIAEILYKEHTLVDYVGALSFVKHVSETLRFTNVGTTVVRAPDTMLVKTRFYVDLRSSIDWVRICNIIAGIAGVVAGIVLALMSAGVGVPASIAVIASSIAMIAGTASLVASITTNPTQTILVIPNIVAEAEGEIERYRSDLASYLDTLVRAGRITSEEASKVMSYVDSIASTAKKAFRDLEVAIKMAYERGRKEERIWTAVGTGVGAIGGLIGGQVLGKVMERWAGRK